MLRAKTIGTFSNCARSIILSGSRCNAVDGSSYTRTEENKHTSRKKIPKNDNLVPKASSTISSVSSNPNAMPVTGFQSKVILPQEASSSQHNVVYVDSEEGDSVHPKSHRSGGLVEMGIATAEFLSDLVSYNGCGILSSTRLGMVDHTRPVSRKHASRNVLLTKDDVSDVGRNKQFQNVKTCGRPVEEGEFDKVRLSGRAREVVENVSGILRKMRWGPETEETLDKLKYSVDVYQANQVLKQLRDHSIALGFFNWLKRQSGFKHDGHTYTTMVGILGRARQFGALRNLLEQMVRDGCRPNVVTYNRIIHGYGRANYLREAFDVFGRMQEDGCVPDRVTYCTLIDVHAKAGYLDVAMFMYRRMLDAGLSPDTFTYGVIINCLGKAGHLSEAEGVFRRMVEHGCSPNLVTYNIMIALQDKARNYQTALRLYRDMQAAGFEPDKVTYSIVMEVLGRCGHLEEAEAVFSEMKRKNLVPDERVYGLLVDLWGKAGNVRKARVWYRSMLDAGLRPNVPTCNSLLSAFLRAGQLADAWEVLRIMTGLGLKPSLQTYTLLLSCCTDARTRTGYDMGFCLELMTITGHPAHVFLLSMPACSPDGQNVRDHVTSFLDSVHCEERESKRGLVDAVVDFLHKSGLKEEAGSVWDVSVRRNVYPDAVRRKGSCYWLINLHVMSDGTAVTALSRTLAWFRRELMISGVGPGRIDIVTGWGRRSRVMGASLVRQAVEELLRVFGFPLIAVNGNSGCFVGCGDSLNSWLSHSYVERMHLL